MLDNLFIKNYALINELDINLSNKLNIITGETGAGKSIILGALGLILGKRADVKSILNNDKKAIIEATFKLDSLNNTIHKALKEEEISISDTLTIRKEILPSGKSRNYLNDESVTANILKKIAPTLLHIHQQFDSSQLDNPNYQLEYIDLYAGNQKLYTSYKEQYKKYKATVAERETLEATFNKNNKELEFLKFQLDELSTLQLDEDEQSTLETELSTLKNVENIQTAFTFCNQSLDSDDGVLEKLKAIQKQLRGTIALSDEYNSLYNRLEQSTIDLEELANESLNIAEQVEKNDERSHQIEQRLNLIYQLTAKHKVNNSNDLITLHNELDSKINNIDAHDTRLAELAKQEEKELATLKHKGAKLSKARTQVFKKIETATIASLKELAIPNAEFKIEHHQADVQKTGIDEIRFLFNANKGGQLQTLKQAASGGERSRISLCLTSLIAGKAAMPSIIFDEIDTGVSGNVAKKMGEILNQLAQKHQVITITHTPQVASRGDQHFVVYKEDIDNRTVSKIKKLSKEARVQELAIMLSEAPPSSAAKENAKELLQ